MTRAPMQAKEENYMLDMNFPDDVLYHAEHLWAKKENDGSVRIGISDYAQVQLTDVLFISLPKVGEHFKQGVSGAELESAKVTSEAIMPMSGTVIAVNEALNDAPELVNTSPYGDGWLMLIKPDNPDEGGLMDAAAYAETLER